MTKARLYGTTISGMTSMLPRSQVGALTPMLSPKMFCTPLIRIQLTPNVAKRVSSGRP